MVADRWYANPAKSRFISRILDIYDEPPGGTEVINYHQYADKLTSEVHSFHTDQASDNIIVIFYHYSALLSVF